MVKNILFAAGECTPFVKTGGLADVIGSLPQSLKEHHKVDVRVMLPLYDEVGEEWREKMEFVTSFSVSVGWRNQEARIYKLEEDVTYYFIANDYYFARPGIYGHYDDGERFVFFSRAIIESMHHIDFTPDVFHAHDWHTGMAVALAKILQPVENMKIVYTIHNLKYQGKMPVEMYGEFFGLPEEHMGGMEWDGQLNSMKAGIFHADKVTTVSPTYSEEIKHAYYGEGLDPVLNDRAEDLVGIINGLDLREFNPLRDPHLEVRYRSSREKKAQNKMLLQERLNLPVDGEKPLYVMITRLSEQKGIHLIQHILDEFLQEDIQFVVLGTGREEFEWYFAEMAHRYEGKMAAVLAFDEGLARQMYASADFFLMPSKYEPCGLAQLMALQYKTVPIVRETGGLKDTVQAFNEYTGEGNGLSFTNYNAHELLNVLRYSVHLYWNEELWSRLVKNVDQSKFGWEQSAAAYIDLYENM